MSELRRGPLALLPLLLWKTPPGLELILGQEGIPFQVIHEPHPLAFRGGRFVLYDSRTTPLAALGPLTTPQHVVIDVDRCRGTEPVDPFDALVDSSAAKMVWSYRGWQLGERVARYPKAWIRRRLIAEIRRDVEAGGGIWMRLAPFPHPYRAAFSFRADLDESAPDDYWRFAMARTLLSDCCTHFVSTQAYQDHPEILADLSRYDTQSHGHYHFVYRDPESNLRNLERADSILRNHGVEVVGFAAPHGRWNRGLDEALETLGYEYSSDFQLGYDDLPFFPWKGDRFSRLLQVPIHPVCEGLFLDAGARDGHLVGDYLARVVREKIDREELAIVYGHPERRLGRMPEVLVGIHRVVADHPLVWRTTLTQLARWWLWRATRRFLVVARSDRRVEVQFDEWDQAYEVALEIQRGRFACRLPVRKPCMELSLDDLVFERRDPPEHCYVSPPLPDRQPPGIREVFRRAVDWETVTPIEELESATLAGRVKKGLRWWKGQRTGTGP